jgi:hypothetical protein
MEVNGAGVRDRVPHHVRVDRQLWSADVTPLSACALHPGLRALAQATVLYAGTSAPDAVSFRTSDVLTPSTRATSIGPSSCSSTPPR